VVYTTIFQLKTEIFLCVLAFHLHDNGGLGAWKLHLLKTIFKVQMCFMFNEQR